MLFLYLHLVSALAFVSLYFSYVIGAGHVSAAGGPWFSPEDLIFSIAFALVSATIWWLHWRWIRRLIDLKEGNARGAHKLYLVAASAWMAFSTLISGATSLNALAQFLIGGGYHPENNGWALTSNLLILGFSIIMWWLHFRRLRALSNPDEVARMESASA